MNVIDSIFSYFLNTEKKLVFTSETIARNYLMNFVSTNPNKAIFTFFIKLSPFIFISPIYMYYKYYNIYL